MHHSSLISLYFCLQVLVLVAGAFQVLGPQESLVAVLGGEADLSCSLWPPQNVKDMQIKWFRSLPSQVLHLYEDGRDKPEEAMEEYLGRTELLRNVMSKGIAVLIIRNVQISDRGQYHCSFQDGSFYSDAVIELKVAVLGSNPRLHVEFTKSEQTRLQCKSGGWFPQPKAQWVDSEGGEIPAESETYTQDKDGLFHVTTSLLLREPSQKNLTCSVWNPLLNQKMEEQLSIAAAESIVTTLIIAVSALATLLAALLILLLIFIGLYLKKRNSKSCHISGQHTNPAVQPTYDRVPADATTDAIDTTGSASTAVKVTSPASASTGKVKNWVKLKRDPQKSECDAEKEAELRSWIEGLTGMPIGPSFQEGLKDGRILSTPMSKLQPGSVTRTHSNTSIYYSSQNLSHFMEPMRNNGNKAEDLFEPSDLSESKKHDTGAGVSSGPEKETRTKGPSCGLAKSRKSLEKQNFKDATMRVGQNTVLPQMGTNQYASPSGMNSSRTQWHICHTSWRLTSVTNLPSLSGQQTADMET